MAFLSLGEAWCDTTTDVGRLMLTIMGGIAEFERGLIRKRCEEGIARAERQGKQFGRPSALDVGQKRVIADRYGKGATIPESERLDSKVGHRMRISVARSIATRPTSWTKAFLDVVGRRRRGL
ncbi:recombinase family protein [Bradyrhizobium jicamae]|uniref:recombinase family protein n=1 Tax=Bradyrhizobium jicamae TaxID=280332 RepID=UPI00390C6099